MSFDEYCAKYYGEIKRLAALCGCSTSELSSIRHGRRNCCLEYAVIINMHSINHECTLADFIGEEKAEYFKRCINRRIRNVSKRRIWE